GRSDFHRLPPRQSARKQDLNSRVQIIAHSLYSRGLANGRHLCRQSESKRVLTVGCRGYGSSTRVDSVAPLGNTKVDDYYRKDSMKYCRHEEEKRNGTRWRGGGRLYIWQTWSVHRCEFCCGAFGWWVLAMKVLTPPETGAPGVLSNVEFYGLHQGDGVRKKEKRKKKKRRKKERKKRKKKGKRKKKRITRLG
ncbi:hypothetical protein B0T14DRAFT_577704, partial [Immersiella caudata]